MKIHSQTWKSVHFFWFVGNKQEELSFRHKKSTSEKHGLEKDINLYLENDFSCAHWIFFFSFFPCLIFLKISSANVKDNNAPKKQIKR